MADQKVTDQKVTDQSETVTITRQMLEQLVNMGIAIGRLTAADPTRGSILHIAVKGNAIDAAQLYKDGAALGVFADSEFGGSPRATHEYGFVAASAAVVWHEEKA